MRMISILAILFLLPLCAEGFATEEDGLSGEETFIPVLMPEGNAEAGRKAFIELQCTACHLVKDEPNLQKPIATDPGPALGKIQAKSPVGWLLDSIVSPSHSLREGFDGKLEGSQFSRMGDYTEFMTVRQLIDIVKFLRSKDESR